MAGSTVRPENPYHAAGGGGGERKKTKNNKKAVRAALKKSRVAPKKEDEKNGVGGDSTGNGNGFLRSDGFKTMEKQEDKDKKLLQELHAATSMPIQLEENEDQATGEDNKEVDFNKVNREEGDTEGGEGRRRSSQRCATTCRRCGGERDR